jgi:DNA mismatch repair ATPase MutL
MFLLAPQTSKAHQYVYVQGRRCQPDVGFGEFLSSISADFCFGSTTSNIFLGEEDSYLSSSIKVIAHASGRPHSAAAKERRTLGQTIAATVAKGFGSGEVSNLVRPDGPKRFERKTGRNGHPSFLFDLWLGSKGPSEKTLVDEDAVNRILEEEIERVLQEKGLMSSSRRRKGTGGTSAASSVKERRPPTSSSLQSQRYTTREGNTPRPRTTTSSTSVQPKPLPMIFPASLKPKLGTIGSSQTQSTKARPVTSRSREDTPEGHVRYVDASSHKTYFVDERTGNSRLASCSIDVEADACADYCNITQPRKRLRKTWADSDGTDPNPPSAPAPAWLSQVLQKWDNPALPTQAEPAISSVDLLHSLRELEGGETADDEVRYGNRSRKRSALQLQIPRQISTFFASSSPAGASAHPAHACHDGPISSIADKEGSLLGADVSKLSLQSARVIAQVATKFVLCVVPDGRGVPGEPDSEPGRDVLLCVDQHAADGELRVVMPVTS